MTKHEAVKQILAAERLGEVSCQALLEVGYSMEVFLRIAQVSDETAAKALIALQNEVTDYTQDFPNSGNPVSTQYCPECEQQMPFVHKCNKKWTKEDCDVCEGTGYDPNFEIGTMNCPKCKGAM